MSGFIVFYFGKCELALDKKWPKSYHNPVMALIVEGSVGAIKIEGGAFHSLKGG